jgi:phosphoglycerate kinase
MAKQTIDQVDVQGRRVLMRVDFNVPLADGVITDDRRIRMALPSIRSVIERGGRLVLMSHCGRPRGEGPEPALSLQPAARWLGDLLQRSVQFPSDDCIDRRAADAVAALDDGEVLVLENLRFHKAEKKGDATFARQLATLGDIYCNDAFGTAHREDASMVAVPEAMTGRPRVAGFLLQKELAYLGDVISDPRPPFVAVLGGAKVSDKLGAIRNLLGRVDTVLVGGAMAYTFLRAQGGEVGASRVEEDMLQEARAILADSEDATTVLLPVDHVCGERLDAGVATRVCGASIDAGWMGLDIGPETAAGFCRHLSEARTIVWNGPMGVFEMPPFDEGTRRVATAIAEATDGGAISVVGGGDSAAAVEVFGLQERFSHVSTGGGASLQMLEGRAFRSVEILDEAPAPAARS